MVVVVGLQGEVGVGQPAGEGGGEALQEPVNSLLEGDLSSFLNDEHVVARAVVVDWVGEYGLVGVMGEEEGGLLAFGVQSGKPFPTDWGAAGSRR